MRDELGGDAVPLGVEVGGRWVQESEAGAVYGLLAAVEDGRVQRTPERVGSEVVQTRVADRRRRADLVEDALHDRANLLLDRPRTLRSDGTGGSREIEEVRALG